MRILFGILAMLCMAACSAVPAGPQASAEVIEASAYRAPGPATLTLITMINNRSGSGGHTALMINGSQRVIYDPAGSFRNARVPQKDDVLYSVSPAVLAGYKSAHARSTYHVVLQTIEVSPETAQKALNLAVASGRAPDSMCASRTGDLLRQLPGFEALQTSMFPKRLMESFSGLAGVQVEKYYEDDEGTILDGIAKVQL